MITSVQNDKVKYWRKLHKRKQRTLDQAFIVEGFHLVEEAIKSNWEIIEIIIQEDIRIPDWCDSYPIMEVSEHVFHHIAETKTPQGIACVVRMKQSVTITGENVLLLDTIQDPGNLGTIIRTADAAGFDGIVLGKGTVDLYNDKVIRATQGSLFHIPIVQADLFTQMDLLKENGFEIWAATLEGAVPYKQVIRNGKIALILGNEGSGIKNELLEKADIRVNIPIYGKAESLNVSIAAAILMYYLIEG